MTPDLCRAVAFPETPAPTSRFMRTFRSMGPRRIRSRTQNSTETSRTALLTFVGQFHHPLIMVGTKIVWVIRCFSMWQEAFRDRYFGRDKSVDTPGANQRRQSER